ncbi:MAG TPA: ATP-binding cassette domain-containing protein [Candidatus Saccharimonadales bacterium]|nr:ATP-binding cassette domain-containing protein [Candidatus Saccharimonadales bacterium]
MTTKQKTSDHAIQVKNLQKSYGQLKLLTGINFAVPRGTILALLGPNGAGKTTTVRILSTLLKPDGGTATINNHDVVDEPGAVRASIGLTGQYAAVDEYLTGEENLLLMGRLYRLSITDTKRRAQQLLTLFDLQEASKRPVKTYSGGMRRKLDLAMSMVASPPIIFLDEPTTGLDPRSRIAMWDTIKLLAKSGITILLTTQYMDEADNLADNIVVIDGGKVIAEGTPDELKAKIGSDRLEFTISKNSSFEKAQKAVDGDTIQSDVERRVVSIASTGGIPMVKSALERLEKAKIEVENISLHRPTLDDVFLTLTGHSATKEEKQETEATSGKQKKGKK